MIAHGPWTDELHGKARVLHEQIAALTVKASESQQHASLTSLLTKPYFDLLDRLFSEELPWAQAMDDSDMVVRLQGPAADQDAPRISLLADTLGLLRKQVQGIAKALMSASADSNFPEAMDLGLSAFARGSIVIGLKIRRETIGQGSLLDGIDDRLFVATRDAVRALGEISRYVDEEEVSENLPEILPDPGVRDIVLSAASRLAPTGRRGIDAVQLVHPGTRWGAALTPSTRQVLRQALARPVQRKGPFETTGVIRELDLDIRRFQLRQIDGMASLRCAYVDLGDEAAKSLMNSTVRVRGNAAFDEHGKPKLLQIESVEVLAPAEEQEQFTYAGLDESSNL